MLDSRIRSSLKHQVNNLQSYQDMNSPKIDANQASMETKNEDAYNSQLPTKSIMHISLNRDIGDPDKNCCPQIMIVDDV